MSALTMLCRVTDVAPGSIKRVEIDGLPPLAVYNVGGTFHVTDDTCTHGRAALSDGELDGEIVECSWHGGRFHVPTGKAVSLPACEAIRTYPVRIIDDQVCLEPAT